MPEVSSPGARRLPRPAALGVALAGGCWLLAASPRASAPAPGLAAPPDAAGPASTPSSPAPLPQPIASYTLRARLDPATHRVTASGTLRWRNPSRTPAHEVYLHLYLNAFKNDRTLFLRSPFGAGRDATLAAEHGFIDVHRLVARELGGVDLWPGADRHASGDAEDETDVRVPLPAPVEPGGTLTLEVEFEAVLPRLVARTGHADGFHLVGQWFPKLARRTPEGEWRHFPFHAQAEFHADFGDYDVTLDVPAGTTVAATGARVEDVTAEGRRVVRHQQAGVHDFAWCASATLEERVTRVGAVEIRVYHPPGHARTAAITERALAQALPHFERHYGRYPYPVLSVVHPPRGAEPAGGMEYPTFITTGGHWAAGGLVRSIEAVTVHELGHQWFQGLLASDEARAPWLDEGVTTWAEGRALAEAHGDGNLVAIGGLRLDGRAVRRALAVELGRDDVVAQPAAGFSSFGALGGLVYARTEAILGTLGRVYGQAGLERAVEAYAASARFTHPEAPDLLGALGRELGADAEQQAHRALFERGTVDYLVRSLRCVRTREPSGYFDRPAGREDHRPAATPEGPHLCRILVVRRGTLRFPVEVELTFDDGRRERRRWDGEGAWTTFEHGGEVRVARAVVDPDRAVLLDEDWFNNAAAREPVGAPRVEERLVWWAALALTVAGP